MKQKRNLKGQYRKSRLALGVIAVAALVFFGAHPIIDRFLSKELVATATSGIANADTIGSAIAQQIVAAKVKAAQDDLLTDLSVKCETKGVKEPDSAILLDTNNEMSIGAFQFQIRTIQHYVSLFEHRQITRVEAIQIAIDHDKAMELARKIVFTENGGLQHNWVNCTARLDLLPRLQEINSFSK